jgi:hypothetical protein
LKRIISKNEASIIGPPPVLVNSDITRYKTIQNGLRSKQSPEIIKLRLHFLRYAGAVVHRLPLIAIFHKFLHFQQSEVDYGGDDDEVDEH